MVLSQFPKDQNAPHLVGFVGVVCSAWKITTIIVITHILLLKIIGTYAE